MICFMIVGLKSNVPYVLKTVPETKIEGEWLKLNEWLNIGFKVRDTVITSRVTFWISDNSYL